MSRTILSIPGRTTDPRQSSAAHHGGKARANNAAGLRQAKAAKMLALETRLRASAAQLFPGQTAVPPCEGGRFFRVLADVTGEEEWTLQTLATRIGLWPWKPGEVVAAFRAREDAR